MNPVEAHKKAAQIHQRVPDPDIGTVTREEAVSSSSAAATVKGVDVSAFNSRPEREEAATVDPPQEGLTPEQVDAFRQYIMSAEAKLGNASRRKAI